MTEANRPEPIIGALNGSKRKYYVLTTDFTLSSAPAPKWVNKLEQMKSFYAESRKPFCGLNFSEPPQIRFDRKGRRGALLDASTTTVGIWLISNRLKAIFERLDPKAYVFQRADVDYSNFPQPGPDYWFCYFMRELDCVDEEQSVIIFQENISWKNYTDLIDVKMRPAAVGSAHAFRLKYASGRSIVDDLIVDAFKIEKIRGFEFLSIQKR